MSGNAWVSGNARVYGNAEVSGDAWVFKSAHYFIFGPAGSRNDFTTFMLCRDNTVKVKCGCFFGTTDEFMTKVKETHGDNKHARVYKMAVDIALVQIEKE